MTIGEETSMQISEHP